MSLEADLFSALKSLVGNRMSPDTFPQPPAVPVWPAIRYTVVSRTPFTDLCGDGDDDVAEQRVQLDVVAEKKVQALALRLQVMAAMRLFVPPATLEISSSEFDPETKTYREIMDFVLHGSTASGNSPP